MKEKRLILTICIRNDLTSGKNKGDIYEQYAKYTLPLMEFYAKKTKSDFLVIDKPDCVFHTCNKFKIGEFLDKDYDRVLYLDADVVVKPNSPNIFETYPSDRFCIFKTEVKWNSKMRRYMEEGKNFLSEDLESYERIKSYLEKNKYYAKNAGVILASKKFKHCFQRPIQEIKVGVHRDQLWQNYLLIKYNIDTLDLGDEWNFRRPFKKIDRIELAYSSKKYFIHFTERSCLNGHQSKNHIKEFVKKIK